MQFNRAAHKTIVSIEKVIVCMNSFCVPFSLSLSLTIYTHLLYSLADFCCFLALLCRSALPNTPDLFADHKHFSVNCIVAIVSGTLRVLVCIGVFISMYLWVCECVCALLCICLFICYAATRSEGERKIIVSICCE